MEEKEIETRRLIDFERQRITILKNQVDFLLEQNKDRLEQISNLGRRVTELENEQTK